MAIRRLTEKEAIQRLVDRMVEFGFPAAEVDQLIVRQGPVDLDMLEECKRKHLGQATSGGGRTDHPPAAEDGAGLLA